MFVQRFADFLPEPMLLLRVDGTIDTVNRAFTETFGWEQREVARHPLSRFVTTPAQTTEFLRNCSRTSSRVVGAVTMRHRNGSEVPCRVDGAALRADDRPERLILLRLLKKEAAVARFVDLTQRIGDLSAQVSRRRRAEEAATEALASERRVRDRLTGLAEGSGALLSTLTLTELLPAIGELATNLMPAHAHAVWQRTSTGREWRVVWQTGLSKGFPSTVEEPTNPDASAQLTEPLYIDDVTHAPLLDQRTIAYASEGIRSLIVIPLRAGDVAYGTVVSYYRDEVSITDDDRHVAAALGNVASSALATTLLYEAEAASRRAAQQAAAAMAFLARAGAALASSLDYEATLRTVAQLAVPEIADWCAVDVATERGDLKRLAVAHEDPAKVLLALDLQARYPSDPRSPHGAPHVLRTGKPLFVARIPDTLLASMARSADHLRSIQELGLTSYMCVPLMSRGRALGVLTFVSAESGREYTEEDVRFAEELASRAALAIENARVYEEVRRANRVKDEFLATLSHELRTPLNAVLGYARMMRTGMLEEDKRSRALEVLERNAVSLNQIVEEILDVSRIVTGKIQLNVQPVDLSVVLHDASATVKPAAESKGVHIRPEVDPGGVRIHGDPDRLQQVFWNLLSNAVKFTPRGGDIQFELKQEGSHAVIRVRDTGVGIGKDLLRHLFEPFTQGDSSFSREHGGLGLGLAIARHIVEMHGGAIYADSEGEGRGATFTVRLPIAAVLAERGPGNREGMTAEPHGAPSLADELSGLRILVVDDDADARMLISDVLQAAGAQVVTFDSATAALRGLEGAELPDVLVTDIGMPGMDGFELMTRIRASSRAEVRTLPAVALTAYARSEDRLRALEHGCNVHIAKPISPQELVMAIRGVARGPAASRRPDTDQRVCDWPD